MIKHRRVFTISSPYTAAQLQSVLRENVAGANELSWCDKDFRGEIQDTSDFWLEEKPMRRGNYPSIKGKIHKTEAGCLITVELNMRLWRTILALTSVAGDIVLLMHSHEPLGVAFRIFLMISLCIGFCTYLFLAIPRQLHETEQKLRMIMK
jgi:hypothetical protein